MNNLAPPTTRYCVDCGHPAHGTRRCGVLTFFTGTCDCTLERRPLPRPQPPRPVTSRAAEVAIFIPVPGHLPQIAKGSAVVGTRLAGDELLLDYEGNVYGAANLSKFADRVAVAAGRHLQRYPTIARSRATDADVVRVGTFTPGYGLDLDADAAALIANWTGE